MGFDVLRLLQLATFNQNPVLCKFFFEVFDVNNV